MRGHRGDDAIDPGAKVGGAGHRLIVGDPIAIERRVGRASAQRVANHDIGDPFALQSLCQRAAGKPRKSPRERHRPDVGNRRHTMRLQMLKNWLSAARLEWPMGGEEAGVEGACLCRATNTLVVGIKGPR